MVRGGDEMFLVYLRVFPVVIQHIHSYEHDLPTFAAYHASHQDVHAPLSTTPCPAGYQPMLRCLPPHAPLATIPYTHIWRSDGGCSLRSRR